MNSSSVFDIWVSLYLGAFEGCLVTDWGPRQQPYPVPCLMSFTIDRVGQELTIYLGDDTQNPMSIWINDELTPYVRFLEDFLQTEADCCEVVIKYLDIVDPRQNQENGIESWTGHVRMELDWNDDHVVLGNYSTDLGTIFVLSNCQSSSGDDFGSGL